MATDVSDLETLPMRNRVSAVAGTFCSRSAMPKARLQTIRPSRITQIDAPGAPRARIVSVMNRSTMRAAGEVEAPVGWGVSVAGRGAHPHHRMTATVVIVSRDRLMGRAPGVESPEVAPGLEVAPADIP